MSHYSNISPPPHDMRKQIIVILAIVFFESLSNGISWPVLITILEKYQKIKISSEEFYFRIATIYSIFNFLGIPVLALTSDKIGRRKVILFSLGANMISNLIVAYAPTIAWLYGARALSGVSDATIPIATAYAVNLTKDNKKNHLIVLVGRIQACIAIGMIFGPVVGGGLTIISSSMPSIVNSILSYLLFSVSYIFLDEKNVRHSTVYNNFSKKKSFKYLKKENFMMLVIFFLLVFSDEMGLIFWPIYSKDFLGFTGFSIGLSLTFCAILVACNQTFILEIISRKFNYRTIIKLGFLFTSIGYFMMTKSTNYTIIFSSAIFLTTGGISLPAIKTLISKQVDSKYQGSLSGILSTITSFAGIFPPLILGFFYFKNSHDNTAHLVWAIPGTISILALLLSHHLKKISAPPLLH